ncbi:aspartyl/asparaginyl beta-hydroxylase domain-containing protein [Acrocarpospora sp. B8E8]|uniref:aspartyl/asparaginyl beta-hydroxylase domain-containing protein n=1 Tax=Acrocarpospora sp. B8E8 TaxID=3153572 RepID=UPI00325D7B7F
MTTLTDQVAYVTAIDPDLLERVRHETLTIPSGWITEYGEYQSGGWGTLSLLNATGRSSDVTITDCDPVETDLLAVMPATRRILADLGLHYMWARIARLEPGGFLWEHRDYGELKAVERHRLHIPLVTSASAFLSVAGSAVHLSAGHLWRLTPTYPHGACNLHGPARIHLILDCYATPTLDDLITGKHLNADDVRLLPPLDDELTDLEIRRALELAQLGYISTAERHLLRLFFTHAMPEGRVYDLISTLHESLGDSNAARTWRSRKSTLLGTTD